jgi:hypothetical protein
LYSSSLRIFSTSRAETLRSLLPEGYDAIYADEGEEVDPNNVESFHTKYHIRSEIIEWICKD